MCIRDSSGIATANRYVAKNGASGVTYSYADNGVVGTAPDAQLLTMKVFGAGGGAYADDYIAAIEDAILLNCDAINPVSYTHLITSAGSIVTGNTRSDAWIQSASAVTVRRNPSETSEMVYVTS